ncbi:protein of unknown function [Salinimicrobium sediminis]|uniref:DUF349 domain-containing protein n=1 Tax=Salinimicrobium sediminis TaxID=1343891 RepID=A0A285X941_9FLAO|nr:DUF349 domain-containing protein [Salinimicrobium sediminis]SOC81304.1 protein of unknown function [Salinimicrobium sediminis]
MSEKENLSNKNLPENEEKNLHSQDQNTRPEKTENQAENTSEEMEERDSIADAMVDEANATEEKRDAESPEAALESDDEVEEKPASQKNETTPPAPEKPVTQNKPSEEQEEKDHISDAIVDENKATEERKDAEKVTSPEAALETDEEDEEKTASQKEDEAKDSTLEEDASEGPKNPFFDAPAPKENLEEDQEEEETSEPAKPRDAQSEMDDAVAEDSEDETTHERHGIEKKDYHAMSKEALVAELEKLLKKEKVQAIKEHVEEIKVEFNAKFDEEVEEKKEEFLAEGGNIIDFHYSTPLKKQFNSLYFDYKENRNKYYQQLKQDLNKNLEKRLEIIEELKGLLDVEENINTTYKHFKDLQDRWKTAGPIPRDKYNTVWNTYHHHVENFYDFLHLNREFRDLDFKHNLEQKLKIISRAEELTQEPDTNRAFRELQMLHKMWKEDLGPVEKEYREDIWQKFSEATKQIHDKRQQYFEQLEKEFEKNLEKKQEIIARIREIADGSYTSHKQWQQKITEVEALREAFFNAGKVPKQVNDETWKKFKEAVRTFNRNKNAFYKNQKKEQYDNLEKKQELVKLAEEHKDSEDFKATTPIMKKIQADWKNIGHVPRRDSDKIWKKFKAACNHYFDRLHASRNEENKEENEAFEQKRELLDKLKNQELSGDRKKDLPVIKSYIEEWKKLGRVPQSKRYIEGKFNRALDHAFDKLDMDKKQTEMLKYENKVQALEDADDSRKLNNEHYFLTKKIEETKAEIRQLENNLQFFSNVDDKNPLVQDVHKNIRDHKEQLKIWKEKLEKVKSLYDQ